MLRGAGVVTTSTVVVLVGSGVWGVGVPTSVTDVASDPRSENLSGEVETGAIVIGSPRAESSGPAQRPSETEEVASRNSKTWEKSPSLFALGLGSGGSGGFLNMRLKSPSRGGLGGLAGSL